MELDLLLCPVCRRGSLARRGAVVGCPNGHAFDVARQGYLNLLGASPPANADTTAMVAARAEFLASGHYAFLADALAAAVPASARTVLDCGAGTGYYLSRVLREHPHRRGFALDVSVPAVRRAARAHPRATAVVADVWQPLPVADASVDVVLSVFAPRNPAEFRRVLIDGGVVITVTPAPEHLAELRRPLNLLDQQPGKREQLTASLADRFRAAAWRAATVRGAWPAATARAAVLMGPNAFHLSPSDLDARLGRLSWPRDVTVAAFIGVWVAR